jgi:hypothetical protein
MMRMRYAVLCGALLAGIFSYGFALRHTLRSVIDPNAEPYRLEAACAGTAATPFRYRVLMVWAIDGLRKILPAHGAAAPPLAAALALETLATLALLVAMWVWVQEWGVGMSGGLVGIALTVNALIVTYLLPTEASHFYWYDIPAVLFVTLGLLAIKRDRLALYYVVFAIGTLNKETTCFLTVAFILLRWRRGRRWLAYHVGAQLVLWLGLKALLCWAAGQPATSTFWWTLPRNLHALADLSEHRAWLLGSALGFVPTMTLVVWPFVHDRAAKRLAAGVSIPFIGGMFLVGWMEEIRIYAELLPVLLPACVLGMQGALHQGRAALHRLMSSAANAPSSPP